ncbi:hypothetical protein HP546_30695 [Pseudomonas sp. CM25]|uniref:hypothetical protein n=1 Tax=Pseudomonas sp. CM25 TaxID=2738448 RepID=UPI001556EA00|nr:hypothetical protein [Pseudomonas sp. CM25]NQD59704.1 hypothetical protein [Pseudomonas sp. CM25]
MQSDEANELKRCRALALEQNQRLLGEAHRRIQQAEQMLTHPQLDAEQFERYKRLKASALHCYAEALEHLAIIDRDFPEPPASNDVAHTLAPAPAATNDAHNHVRTLAFND